MAQSNQFNPSAAPVAVVMGSQSDWETMQSAVETLDHLRITSHQQVISAHRTPDLMFDFAEQAQAQGFKVIIAGAGGAAHLPGMIASKTLLPVIGVPAHSKALGGMDSLLSIVQMPGGVPVNAMAIGQAGAINAALSAASMLGLGDPSIFERLAAYRQARAKDALNARLEG